MTPANGGRRVRGQGSGLRSCHRRRRAADCCARGTGAGRAGAGRGQGADRAQAGPRAGPHLKPSPSCRPVDRALHRAPAPTREVRLLSRRATRFVPTGWSAVRFRLPGSAVVRWRCCRLVMSDRGMPVRQGSAYERDASLVASSRSMEVPFVLPQGSAGRWGRLALGRHHGRPARRPPGSHGTDLEGAALTERQETAARSRVWTTLGLALNGDARSGRPGMLPGIAAPREPMGTSCRSQWRPWLRKLRRSASDGRDVPHGSDAEGWSPAELLRGVPSGSE